MTFKEWIGTAPIDEVAKYLDDWVYGIDGTIYGVESMKRTLLSDMKELLKEDHISAVLHNKSRFCDKTYDNERKCYETCPLRKFNKDTEYCVPDVSGHWEEIEKILRERGDWDEEYDLYSDFSQFE